MIDSAPGGVIVAVRVVPRASASGIAGTRGEALLVRLHAPPVEGAANEELVRVMASLFGVPRRSVRIATGQRSRSKTVHVEGISAAQASQALAEHLDTPRP